MSDFHEQIELGRTGLHVGRLGVAASYGVDQRSLEEAFEQGVNYFYWGSRRTPEMGAAIRSLAKKQRERLVVCVQSYSRLGFWLKRSFEKALREAELDYADVLLLGWFNDAPPARIMDAATELVASGKARHIAISSHRRPLFPTLLDDQRIGIWQVRYNAVHRGAEREVFQSLDGLDVGKRPGVITYTTTRWGHLLDPKRTPAGETTPSGADCYRFAMSHPHVDVVMSGPANGEQMREALRALELGPMNEDELARMRRIGDGIYGKDRTSGMRD
ncbi:MAG: aldo/keto reductase [Polyangiaceae bacterium]|nr:aldo/keto reductase [Polyangiaceae bacterium]MCE7891825.1 aldo/keto reductase [Sorangiineae bacterium PRO1]MCL4752968.1 aldo/keto reductase [Myxococcales bacterium]